MYNDKEAAAALNELSLYCEGHQCRNCIFRHLDGWRTDRTPRYTCTLEDDLLCKLRAITTNGEIRVVTEEEALNNEN
jgi:hypothetical protein